MSDESRLRKKAHEAMQAGKLPSLLPPRMWGGPGVGACCTICGTPVQQDELELEFIRGGDDREPGNHHVHVRCFAAWEFEHRNASGQVQGTGVSAILPALGNDRMIAVYESDGTDQEGSG